MLAVKLIQTAQKIKILGWESWVNKKWQAVAITREILDSNLETGRYSREHGSPEILLYYNNNFIINYQSK